jgi:hypothetical protein
MVPTIIEYITISFFCTRFKLSFLKFGNWPSKVGQIKNPGITIMSCILIRCTYDKNLEMIQQLISSGDIALFVFSVLAPGGQAKNQTWPKFGLWVTLT